MRKLGMFAIALMLFASSWQVFNTTTQHLEVHETPDPKSAICWQGKAFTYLANGEAVNNYNGQCVDQMSTYLIK